MRASRKLVLMLAVTACAAFTALAPGVASADVYFPGQSGGNFTTGAGGWGGSTTDQGLCVPAVTCPIVSYSAPATGGVGGGGHLRTSIVGLATAATETDAKWTSPPFTYNGNGGGPPTAVFFQMFRRSNIAALLAAGGTANYSVVLRNRTTGVDLEIIPERTQQGADNWTAVEAGINPNLLTIGHSYDVVITSTFGSAGIAMVLPMGDADYDSVLLSTAGGPGGVGSPYGGPFAGLSAAQRCIKDVKRKIKAKKISKKRKKKLLKKKIANCRGKKVIKKKKKKRRKRR